MNDDEARLPVPASAWIYPTLVHGVLALTVFTRLLLAGPRFGQFYDEWKLAQPATTQAFVSLSARMENSFFTVMAVLLAALAIDCLLLWLLGGWRRFEGRLWFFLVIAFFLLTWGLMEVSFFIPYFRLLRGLSR
jgi:type II secretory pathway component PulF